METGKGKIIAVSGGASNLLSIKNILSPHYEVLCFNNYDKGLRAIREINPSLILADIYLPREGGFVLTAEIKRDSLTRDIPVILFAEPRGDGDEVRSFESGASDFIFTPFKSSVLLARVRTRVEAYKHCRELEANTVTDVLTGIYNRRGFNEMLAREWRRAKRDQMNLSLLMIDIDHFKYYNDNYGHQGGDVVLTQIGQTIKNTLRRAADIATRYGGEEFAVILPGTNEKGAAVVAGNILNAVRNLKIPHAYSSAASIVTVSIGIAASGGEDNSGPDSLLKAADAMMYRAKETGRNKFTGKNV